MDTLQSFRIKLFTLQFLIIHFFKDTNPSFRAILRGIIFKDFKTTDKNIYLNYEGICLPSILA